MTPVTSLAELDREVANVRRRADAYVTNLYSDRATLEKWVNDGCLNLIVSDNSLIITRRQTSFTQLFFASSNQVVLTDCLREALRVIAKPTVVDLIGPEATIGTLSESFRVNGFTLRERLRRMSIVPPLKRSTHTQSNPSSLVAAEARLRDVESIGQALAADFDPFVDQFPSHDELERLILNHQVLVCLTQDRPAGFLLSFRHGSTALIKYWYVSPTHRGQGVGSLLMTALIESEPQPKRLLLWVKDRNQSAIERYEHFGFRREGLVDEVYCLEDTRS